LAEYRLKKKSSSSCRKFEGYEKLDCNYLR